MKHALLLLWLLAGAAYAQITVSTVDSKGVESAVGPTYNAGQAPLGDLLDTRIRLRNSSQATVTLQTLRIAGAGFSLVGNPLLPYAMAPSINIDFRVRFQPSGFGSYSATLTVNERTILILATCPQGITVQSLLNGQPQTISSSATLTLGSIEKGQSVAYPFRLFNETSAPLDVAAVSVTGAMFTGPAALSLPARLLPGASAPFEVRFTPVRSGIFPAQLVVDGRSFPLEAVAFDPPLPDATISVSPTSNSAAQGKLSLRFAQATRSASTATVRLAFQPNAAKAADDPAVVWVTNAARTLSLTVAEGVTAADVFFQTGTTAGAIAFTVNVGLQTLEASTLIAPAIPGLDKVTPTRTATALEVAITGFDNTRTAGALAFTFYDLAGKALGPVIRADASSAFSTYFSQSTVGGLFVLRAVFPVTGDPAQIGGVEVELANSAGSAKSPRTSF